MNPTSVLSSPSLRPLRAAALILGAVALTASSALASTAANTVITNTATVNFNDAGGARSLTGMAIRFSEFEAESGEMLGLGLTRMRILH